MRLGGALVGAQERRGLLADARRLPLEPERLDVLPAGLRARAAVRARVAAQLDDPVARRDRVDPAAGLEQLLLDRRRRQTSAANLVLALRAHDGRASRSRRRARIARSARRQSRPCPRARRRTGRARRRAVLPLGARPRGERARTPGRRGAREVQARAARPRARPPESRRRSQAKPQAPPTRTRTPIPSLSASLTVSTWPFFVATVCARRSTTRASAYGRPRRSAASTASPSRGRARRRTPSSVCLAMAAPRAVADLLARHQDG